MGVEVASLPAQCQRSQARRQLLRYLHLQQCKEFTMLVTELIISYATYPPLSLSLSLLYAVCVRVWQQLSATRSCRNSSQQGRPNQGKPRQASRQQEAVPTQTSLAYSCHVFLLPLPLPLPLAMSPSTDAKATSGSQHRSRLS